MRFFQPQLCSCSSTMEQNLISPLKLYMYSSAERYLKISSRAGRVPGFFSELSPEVMLTSRGKNCLKKLLIAFGSLTSVSGQETYLL